MIEWITLLAEPKRVREPNGLVYSTAPREALATDGKTYIIKGPELPVVFAEHAGYSLAECLGLPVPEHALCSTPQGIVFASRKLPLRFAGDDMFATGSVVNPELLSFLSAFDVWIANEDRNVNNFVGDYEGRGTKLFAIDFEKAHALNGRMDLFSVTARPPREMMPREGLGARCKGQPFPTEMCDRIAQNTNTLDRIVDNWHSDLGLSRITWADRARSILTQRAQRISSLVQEAWR
ncbi:MAG TPA: HipA family kinase [Longimicrobiaceae bacterium]|jgi:hypothetical protein|nr:HipA family kinase [Longimicrobiaceae bacterium]